MMAPKSTGRAGRPWLRLAANLRAQRRPCCRCGQAIDYDAEPRTPRSFSVEHIKPRSTHPHLAADPTNLDAAHYGCNSSGGNRGINPVIGVTSRRW